MSNKQEKMQIAENTLAILKDGVYQNSKQEAIDIQIVLTEAIAKSELWTEENTHSLLQERNRLLRSANKIQTVFEVNNETTLTACHRLSATQKRIFCLNFASAKNAGGGFLGGAQAQEESLARSSGLYPCLTKFQAEFYDYHRRQTDTYYSDKMIYSPQVPVFKDDTGSLLHNFYEVSFLTSPAVNVGALKQKGEFDQTKADKIMLARTEKLLSIALVKGYQHLVLGAWGCGVFQNDPQEVARYFAKLLTPNGLFANCFQHIIFAVLSSKDNNIAPFEKAFGREQL
ncbi:MAG: TIGR02452 family protein [Thermoflexibacter sp.]|jgi:uncharacterized protein (TIGR02452 family)|nr:TIGR02452 family protein [Thermoflexibacter sp.]